MATETPAERPDLDTLVVPVGGGGLISGIATAAKAIKPGVRVVGVQTSSYSSIARALRGESLAGEGNTIAEGIAVKLPGKLTLEVIRARVDEMLLVEEPDIERAMALYLNVEKTVAEGAGAAALAAVLSYPDTFRGRNVGVVCWRQCRSAPARIGHRAGTGARAPDRHHPGADRLPRPGALAKVTAAVAGAARIVEGTAPSQSADAASQGRRARTDFRGQWDESHAAAVIEAVARQVSRRPFPSRPKRFCAPGCSGPGPGPRSQPRGWRARRPPTSKARCRRASP